jgi:hypothetical protein
VLETGDMRRFPTVGDDAAYGRCGQSTNIGKGKRQGQGNVNHGNPYLEWAYVEAAPFAIRCAPREGPAVFPTETGEKPSDGRAESRGPSTGAGVRFQHARPAAL